MKDLLSKENYCYKCHTLLMNSSAYSSPFLLPPLLPPPSPCPHFYKKISGFPFYKFPKLFSCLSLVFESCCYKCFHSWLFLLLLLLFLLLLFLLLLLFFLFLPLFHDQSLYIIHYFVIYIYIYTYIYNIYIYICIYLY